MTPQVLVAYTNTLFAEGLLHLLANRADCAVSAVLPVGALTEDRLAQVPGAVIILEGGTSDPQVMSAMRLLLGRRAALTVVRVDLSAPTLHVYRADAPVPAGLDELTSVIRGLAMPPASASDRDATRVRP